jgi:sulfoxide reductase heme-binding subunit YedZ
VTRRGRLALKSGVWAGCLAPLASLLVWAWHGDLTANPISFATNWLGDWALRIFLVSLALTPLRLVTGMAWQMPLRRLLGLFAFFYASLHVLVWLALDHFFDWRQMGTDIAKRPYITVGFTALLLLLPLAVTSTDRWMRRLGRRWQQLHRLVYAAALLGCIHFWWQVKADWREPLLYVSVYTALMAWRWHRSRRGASVAAARSPSRASRPITGSASTD